MFPKVVLSKAVSPCLAMHCEVTGGDNGQKTTKGIPLHEAKAPLRLAVFLCPIKSDLKNDIVINNNASTIRSPPLARHKYLELKSLYVLNDTAKHPFQCQNPCFRKLGIDHQRPPRQKWQI